MQEDKFGKLIKEIRKQNNLTQKELADKYHVTYQAVSKWENGKNLPDISLMKEIGRDFNVSLDDMMDGKLKEKEKKKSLLIIITLSIIVISLILFFLLKDGNDDFETREITSLCKDYKISGVISYNKSKSAIYIPKIEYCGEKNNTTYHEINCTLYEKNNDITKTISVFTYNEDKAITIEDFMKLVSFNVDNYLKVCNAYNKDSFYLEIKALDDKNNMFFHTIPLTLDENCLN